MDGVPVSGYDASWDPVRRIAHFRKAKDAPRTRPVARALSVLIDEWVGPTGPFVMLVDCTNTGESTLVWRLEWVEILRRLGPRLRMGVYNLDETLRTDLESFRRDARIELHVFRTREEAEVWSLDRGLIQ